MGKVGICSFLTPALYRDADAAAGSQNVAEAARAEATACVKQLQVVLTGALAAYSLAML